MKIYIFLFLATFVTAHASTEALDREFSELISSLATNENSSNSMPEAIHDLVERYSETLYGQALDTNTAEIAIFSAWVPVLERYTENTNTGLRNRILMEIASYDWIVDTRVPSPAKSAWILLTQHDVNGGTEENLAYMLANGYDDGLAKPWFIYAVTSYAEVGSVVARDVLVSEVQNEVKTDDDYFRAKLAARGLLIPAYQHEDKVALNGLENFRKTYMEYMSR